MKRPRIRHGLCLALALLAAQPAQAQSLEERLDEERFLRELGRLGLPEVLDHYVRTHPAADPARAAAYRIAALRGSLRDADATTARRLADVQGILQIRRALIDEHRDDPRRAIWLIDQAADLYFELLPIDATGLTSLLGVPTLEQRDRAQLAARQMHELMSEAETELDRALLELEARPGYRDDMALQQERRRLSTTERDRRAPFLRGVAAVLHATINVQEKAEARRLYALAASALEPLPDRLEGRLAIEARFYEGLALAHLGEFDRAEALFEQVRASGDAHPIDRLAAGLGQVMSESQRAGPEAALAILESIQRDLTGPDAALARLLLADQAFLLRRQIAQRAPDAQHAALLADAFAVYTDLLEARIGLPPEAMQAIVLAKLTSAAGSDTPLERLPAIVSIARADHLARLESSRAEGVALYEQVLERVDLSEREQAEALYGLGRALRAAGQPLAAARRLETLARDHPTDFRAEQAIELAAMLAETAAREARDDAEARALLRETLDLLLSRYPNVASVDRWRYRAGVTALEEERFEDAIHHFQLVPPDAVRGRDAQFMQVVAARAWAEATSEPPARRERVEHTLALIDQVEPALRQADASHDLLARLLVMKARSQVALAEADRALQTLAQIDVAWSLDPAVHAEVLRARIEASQAAGRIGEALEEVQRFLAAAPQQAGAVVGSMLSGMVRQVRRLRDEGRDEDRRALAEQELLPLADLLREWLRGSPDSGEPAAAWLAIAEAERLGGRPAEALPVYERLLLDQPDAVELLFGRAECLQADGVDRLADAMLIYRRIALAGVSVGPRFYWTAQLRMLQILDRTGRNLERIVPRIQRLRREDPALGGRWLQRQFSALERKHLGS